MDDNNARGQSLTEYIIVVLVIAIIVIIAVRTFGGGMYGKFQNATDSMDSVGSNKPPPIIGSSADTGSGGGGEQSDQSAKSSRSDSSDGADSESKRAKSASDKSEGKDLDSKVSDLRTEVGDADSRVVSKIQIDWPVLILISGIIIAFGVVTVLREKYSPDAKNKSKEKKRKFSLRGGKGKGEDGQVLVIGLFVCVGLMMAAMTVANVGMMVAEKIKLQDTVDASAYSAAVVEARYMNLSAYINRAMIANYDMMAFDTALWAVIDADDHGMAAIISFLYQVDAVLILFPFTTAFGVNLDTVIDLLQDVVHHPLHTLNHEFNDLFAQDDDAQDLNQYIEIYNIDILTMYQGLLYAAMQASRFEVEREVAQRMDPEVLTTSVLGLGAEAVSYDELARAVDYVIRDTDAREEGFLNSFNKSFNDMAGRPENEDDNPLLLAAVTEASLDRFVAGRTRDGDEDLLRSFNFGNIIPLDALETALDIECNIEEIARAASPLALFTDPLDCNADLNFTLGARFREGFEDRANQTHVPFIARRRMREVNFFGIGFTASGLDGIIGSGLEALLEELIGERGHTSGEKNNDVGNVANSTFSFEGINFERAVQTFLLFGTCAIGTPIPTCGLNSFNIIEASTMIPVPLIPPIVVDDHWDGTFEDVEPVQSYQLIPPGVGNVEVVEYVANVAADGVEDGVPKYDWQVDLDNVGIPNYIYPTTGAQARPAGTKGGGNNNLLSGPSIAVVGVKAQESINNIQGLGIGNPYSMTAIARSQVYYVRNPNRPDELPSLFNPHWVARLAPIESEDTPSLLRDGLPFVSSVGLGLDPTH